MPARLIYLLGCDGSGKSTVAEHTKQYLEAKNRTVCVVWATLRPVILWPINKVAKFLFVRKHNKFDNYTEHIKAKKKGVQRFQFLLKPLLYLSFLDYYPQYIWKVVRVDVKCDDLICDRYYFDMLIERAIMLNIRPDSFPNWIMQYGRFFRKPDLALYLRTSPEVAIQRKTDIPSEEYLQERMLYYEVMAQVLQAHVIDGNQPLSTVLAQVRECIDNLDHPLLSNARSRELREPTINE